MCFLVDPDVCRAVGLDVARAATGVVARWSNFVAGDANATEPVIKARANVVVSIFLMWSLLPVVPRCVLGALLLP